jgi:hypothetical protein
VPSDFDMRRPSVASTVGWMTTSRNGSVPVKAMPIITMRATQRLMMSRAVNSACPG